MQICYSPTFGSGMLLPVGTSCIWPQMRPWSYGFRFVTPPPPPQCVERFHHYYFNETYIKASLLKFAGYIHNHKILPVNMFGIILKNKMGATGVFSTFSKDFCGPSRAKGIIGRDLKQGMFLIPES